MKITKLDNYSLLEHYKKAIKDSSYQFDNVYNQSGFNLEDLEDEVLYRMVNRDDEDDE